jgi:hypothetical protein
MLHRHVHSFFDPIASGPTDVAEGPVAAPIDVNNGDLCQR